MNQKTSNRISLDESKIIRQSRHATRELSLLNTDNTNLESQLYLLLIKLSKIKRLLLLTISVQCHEMKQMAAGIRRDEAFQNRYLLT